MLSSSFNTLLRYVACICFVFFPFIIQAQQEELYQQDKRQQTFNLNPDNLGALENSVNLFTGQVSFPMNLVSLPGRGGLDVSVNLLYNSGGVPYQSDIWNVEAPTSVVGLGWTMDIPKIVCDHKQTGARADDDFYVVENGQSVKLICVEDGFLTSRYKPEKDLLWKVKYNKSAEKWTITKENGFEYVYGDKNSDRGTVQWMVRWGNWIGNSTQPVGQEQMAYIWNISEVENLWGDKLTFTYDNEEEFVARDIADLTTEKKHTKASYLKKIQDPTGKSVEFLYGEKIYESLGKQEYQDPHMEQSEPDAYQEKYETRYLDRLIVRNENDSLLYETDLSYNTDLVGDGNTVKRLLTSIKKIYPSGNSMPPVRFEYFDSNDETVDVKGCLKKVFNSYGAFYEYEYKQAELPLSTLDLEINAPTPGQWKEHYTYIGNNYALVVWRTVNSDGSHNSGFRPCRIYLYTWDGRWHSELLNDQNINIKTREVDGEILLDWRIVLGDNFFAFLYEDDNGAGYDGRIYHRKEQVGAVWRLQAIGTNYENPVLLSGNDFVAWAGVNEEEISTYVFTGEYGRFADIDVDEYSPEHYVSAANNYIFVHNDNKTGQDYIHLFYLDQEKRWQKSSASSGQLFNTDDGSGVMPSFWHSFNSFTMGLPWDNEEYIYQWNENYNSITRKSGWGRLADDSYVFSRVNSLLGVVEKGGEARAARYNGSLWQFTETFQNSTHRHYSFGNDFFIDEMPIYTSYPDIYPKYGRLKIYSPNIGSWSVNIEYQHQTPKLHGNPPKLAVEAGNNAFILGDGDLYTRTFYGQWNYLYQLKLGTDEYLIGPSVVVNTPSLVAYDYIESGASASSGSYLILFKNGQVDRELKFEGAIFTTKHSHVGGNIVIHVESDTKLRVRKILNRKAEGNPAIAYISKLQWYDGNRMFFNSYDFDPSVAKADPSGQVAYFNKASVIQGSDNIANRPFGHTDYYFFNGLTFDQLAKQPLQMSSFYYNVPLGDVYETNIVSAAGDTVSYTRNAYTLFKNEIYNTDNEQVAQYKYIRATDIYSRVDNIETETSNTYDPATGLLKDTESFNSTASGQSHSNTREFTYWPDVYDEDNRNIFSVVKATNLTYSYAGSDTTGASVTRWRKWNGNWAPDKTYGWLRKNSAEFTAWDYPAEPTASEWKTATNILQRDLSTGAVLENSDPSGIKQAVIYDNTKTRPFATVVNAGFDQIAYAGFEDQSQGNWLYSQDSVVSTDAATGLKAFDAASQEITSATLPVGDYTVSYWAKNNTPQTIVDDGSLLSEKSYSKPDNWTLHVNRINVNGPSGKVRIQVQGLIDEVRLHPVKAQMTTYAYNEYGSAICETSPIHLTTRYEYDDQNRPFLVRDHEGNIVKRYTYSYRDDDEHRSALLFWTDTAKVANDVVFRVNHPDYASGTVEYLWDFGDGVQAATDTPSVAHAYQDRGFYAVSVKVSYPGDTSAKDSKSIQVIPGAMTASILGDQFGTACEGGSDSETLSYSAQASGGCGSYTYRWYVVSGGVETEFGSGSDASYIFYEPGSYTIYCIITDACGNMQSPEMEVNLFPNQDCSGN